ETRAQRSDELRLAHRGQGKFGWTRNALNRETHDAMGLLRLHHHGETRELIGIAFLHHARHTGGRRLLQRAELEAAAALAEIHLLVDLHWGEAGLQKAGDSRPVAGVERFQPGPRLAERHFFAGRLLLRWG